MADRFRSRNDGIEWPTLTLLVATYLVWGFATTALARWAPPIAVLVAAVAIAQFSSLQHEILHGHPFRNRRLNEALVFPGLTVWVPYIRFRDTHLAHHHDPMLTDPYDDPETNYLDPAVWARLSRPVRHLLRLNNTLLGRMVLGPVIGTVAFVRDDWRKARAGDRAIRDAWLWHVPSLALVLVWLWTAGSMSLGAYLLASYLGYALLKIRTFLEHRAHEKPRARSAIVEDRGPLALLFLNINLHAVHHQHPQVPWYRLPAAYRAGRDRYLKRNEGYRYGSYAEVIRAHLLKPKDPVPHPLYRPR